MALGATPRGVVSLVLTEGSRLAGAGLVLGLVVAIFAARSVANLLSQVSTYDLPTYLVVVSVLVATVLLGSLVPALRVNPTVALRGD